MKTNITSVAKELLDDLSGTFESLGFRLNKSKKRCTRVIGDTTQEIQFIFDNSMEGVLLTVMLYVTNESIESVFKKATDGSSLWHLGIDILDAKRYFDEGLDTSHNDEVRFVIPDFDKAVIAGKLLKEYLEKYAFRYFAESDSVEKIDNLLNKKPTEMIVHHDLYPSRATIGLIAAYMSENPKYEELVAIYEKETQDASTSFRERFKRVVATLSNDKGFELKNSR